MAAKKRLTISPDDERRLVASCRAFLRGDEDFEVDSSRAILVHHYLRLLTENNPKRKQLLVELLPAAAIAAVPGCWRGVSSEKVESAVRLACEAFVAHLKLSEVARDMIAYSCFHQPRQARNRAWVRTRAIVDNVAQAKRTEFKFHKHEIDDVVRDNLLGYAVDKIELTADEKTQKGWLKHLVVSRLIDRVRLKARPKHAPKYATDELAEVGSQQLADRGFSPEEVALMNEFGRDAGSDFDYAYYYALNEPKGEAERSKFRRSIENILKLVMHRHADAVPAPASRSSKRIRAFWKHLRIWFAQRGAEQGDLSKAHSVKLLRGFIYDEYEVILRQGHRRSWIYDSVAQRLTDFLQDPSNYEEVGDAICVRTEAQRDTRQRAELALLLAVCEGQPSENVPPSLLRRALVHRRRLSAALFSFNNAASGSSLS